MDIKLGLGLHWDRQSYADLVELIEDSQGMGYRQIWVANEKFFHDMYVTATLVAEHTTGLDIGTFVVDPYSQHPALTARGVATLDEASGGRAILGIGAGGTGFPAMGIHRVKPAQAIKEAIHVIRGLLRGETVDFHGEIIQAHQARLNFDPRPNIPIVVASRGDLVLQVAGEVADGVMIATYAEPGGVRHGLSMVTKGAERAGRTLADLTISSRVDTCIHEDRRVAIEALKPFVGVFLWTSYPDRKFVHRVGLEVPAELEQIIARRDYNLMAPNAHLIPDAFVEKFCWAGTADEVAEKVAAVIETGIQNIVFLPHTPPDGSVRDTIEAFAQSVMPMLEEKFASETGETS